VNQIPFRFQEFLNSDELSLDSPASLNTVCIALASVLKSVIIYLLPRSTEKIHVSTPVLDKDLASVINVYPLFVVATFQNGKYLFAGTETTELEINHPSDREELDRSDYTGKCSCGKGRKNTTGSCISQRCPCACAGEPCSDRCNCQLCENCNGRRYKDSVKLTKCRCGENSSNTDTDFCVTSNCSCRKLGFSCTVVPLCHCRQCKNINGARDHPDCSSRKRKNTDRILLMQKSAGKLPRIASEDFFKLTGQKLVPSIWNERETILLMVLSNYLHVTEPRVSVKPLMELFNLYASEENNVRKKSNHQVLYKIRHLDNKRKICNY
jgi:hypothetical protein